ncbi:MAG: prepilin peptidase [Pirellulales bacterium]|nr:prepilin peptidase [Pirellulales bacterium]
MLTLLLLVWLAALGGTIGSFLNVVVYRLPAGKSLVYPGSYCPVCKHPIRWHDNVPVFGWLALGGHCRDCGVWIPIRYPLVEAITALVFLLVGAAELLSGGGNLPMRPEAVVDGAVLLPWTPERLAGILAYHLFLLSTLLPIALIEYDKKPGIWRAAWPALLIGLLAPVAWPQLHPVPAGPVWTGWHAGLADGAAGLLAGLVVGAGMQRLAGRGVSGLCAGPACVGLFLGWQAVVVVTVAAAAIHGLGRGLGRRAPAPEGLPFNGWLALGTLVWVTCWRAIIESFPRGWP